MGVPGWQPQPAPRPAPHRSGPRAHGATGYIGPDDAFSFDGLADDVVALLDRLGVARPVVAAGVSMGAGIALNLALRYPDRVTALVMVRPAWLDQPLPPNLKAYPLIAELLRKHGPDEGLTRFERSGYYRDLRAESAAGAASLLGQFTAPYAVERAVRLDRMPRSAPMPGRRRVRQVRQPALVVGAPRDPGASAGTGRGHRGRPAGGDAAGGDGPRRGSAGSAGPDRPRDEALHGPVLKRPGPQPECTQWSLCVPKSVSKGIITYMARAPCARERDGGGGGPGYGRCWPVTGKNQLSR